MGLAEGGGFGFAEGAEFAGAALDDGAGDFVRKRSGYSAGTLGKRENVEIGEGQALDEGDRGGVVVFRFAGKAGDDVSADGGVGEAFVDELDAAGVVLSAVPAMHGGEDGVGSGLQRHVEVPGDAIGPGEEIDEVLSDIERLNGADAEAFDGGFIEDAAEEVFEFDAGGEIAAVGAEVDAAEDDFARREKHARRFGMDRQECLSHREALDFADYGVWREAAALAANKGDNAIGAAGVTAVLDLESGTSMMAFAAEDGGGEKLGLVEDVASENVSEMGRNKLRHFKGMERSGRIRRKRHCGVGIRGNSGGEISYGFREGGSGEKVVCGFGWFGGGSRERID